MIVGTGDSLKLEIQTGANAKDFSIRNLADGSIECDWFPCFGEDGTSVTTVRTGIDKGDGFIEVKVEQ